MGFILARLWTIGFKTAGVPGLKKERVQKVRQICKHITPKMHTLWFHLQSYLVSDLPFVSIVAFICALLRTRRQESTCIGNPKVGAPCFVEMRYVIGRWKAKHRRISGKLKPGVTFWWILYAFIGLSQKMVLKRMCWCLGTVMVF